MGPYNDIRHQLLDDPIGPPPGGYTRVVTFMARPREPHELAESRTGLLLP
jgi:hypothetical protein